MNSLLSELAERSWSTIEEATNFIRTKTNEWLLSLGLETMDLSSFSVQENESIWGVITRLIDQLIGDTNLNYEKLDGTTTIATTHSEMVNLFKNDYLAEASNWFYNPFFAMLERIAKKIDVITQSISLFNDLLMGSDKIFQKGVFLFEAAQLPAHSTIIPALKDIFGWNMESNLVEVDVNGTMKYRVHFEIPLSTLFNIIKSALFAQTGLKFDIQSFDKRSLLDIILYCLIADKNRDYGYGITKTNYLQRNMGQTSPKDGIFGKYLGWKHPFTLFWIDTLEFGVNQYIDWQPLKGGL